MSKQLLDLCKATTPFVTKDFEETATKRKGRNKRSRSLSPFEQPVTVHTDYEDNMGGWLDLNEDDQFDDETIGVFEAMGIDVNPQLDV